MTSTGVLLGLCLLASILSSRISGKECTNTPTELSSHTIRAEMMKDSEFHDPSLIALHHSAPPNASDSVSLLPRKLLIERSMQQDEFELSMLFPGIEDVNLDGVRRRSGQFLKEVSLHDVRLDPESVYGHAQQTNLEYLLMLDVNRLAWCFRKQAGLPAPGEPYGGWEAPNVELRGHFVGHYMSASAQMWASTHNDTLYEKMTLLVDALHTCQKKVGTGYLSAFPPEFFDRFEAVQYVWAPYYTIHKIMAGLLEQYLLAGNSQALKMVTWMAEYFANRVENVIRQHSIERHWRSLNEETGGMNDVLYRLYTITGDQKHLTLAYLFDKPCFLGLLAVQADSLSGFHANTHIPIVVGAQLRYEITGDKLYKEIGTFFMDVVNSSHSYATGGTSVDEFWSDPNRLGDTLKTENEESCTTYNMLKVSRNLFRWTKDIRYADYYERALTNGVLGIQRGGEPGKMIYMLPFGHGNSKARSNHGWGTKFDSFWCCYGTGVESFSKLGDSIFYEEEETTAVLYITQFIPSYFNWKSGRVLISQKIKPLQSGDSHVEIVLTICANEMVNQTSTLNVRIPFWGSSSGAKASLNSQDLHLPHLGDFLSVTRNWGSNDTLKLHLPISLRTEAIKDDRPKYKSIEAILFGPYVLAGLSTGDWEIKTENSSSMFDWITAVPTSYQSQLVSLSQWSPAKTFYLSNSKNSLIMESVDDGTDSAVHATFRLFSIDSNVTHTSASGNIIGQYIKLEPFDLPGAAVVHQGPGQNLSISSALAVESLFQVVPGMDGANNTISLESATQSRCYVSSGEKNFDDNCVKLICEGDSTEKDNFLKSTSFRITQGIRRYHPISFMTKVPGRNFLLEPLNSLRDESYNVYFDIKI